MKKFYLAVLTLCTATFAYGQCAIDPALVGAGAGIYPPTGSVTNGTVIQLPAVNQFQSTSIVTDVIVLQDTTLTFFGLQFTVPIDSMKIVDIIGIPPGMSYNCDNSICGWIGGAHGCIGLIGAPTQQGSYSMSVNTEFVINVPGLIDTVAPAVFTFDLEVLPPASIFEDKKVDFNLSPNPANNYVDIRINRENEEIEYELLDMLGKSVKKGVQMPDGGNIRLNTDQLINGFYILRLTSKDQSAARRLIIRH